jgi:hypothetical protein
MRIETSPGDFVAKAQTAGVFEAAPCGDGVLDGQADRFEESDL